MIYFYISITALFLICNNSILLASQSPPIAFDQYEIELGDEKHQTILSGDLIGDSTNEISVTSRDTLGNTSISIYSFVNEFWTKSIDAKLPKNVLFVDICKIAGKDRLIYYEPGVFSWYDPEKYLMIPLFSYPLNYTGMIGERIHWVNMTKDLNDDNLDEFIIPGFDFYSIFIQNSDGSFSDPVKLGSPEPYLDEIAVEDIRTYREVGLNALTIPWYLSRVHFYDHNLDGNNDLVFWNKDQFDVYYQTETGYFDPIPHSFEIDFTTGTDAPYSLTFQFSGKGGIALILGLRKSSTHKYLLGIRDINGDGIADMVTHTLSGRSPLKMKSKYNVYYGSRTETGTQFRDKTSSEIFPSGKAGLGETAGYSHYWFSDLNGDNKKDLFRYDVRISIGSILRTFLMKTVYIDYEYFQNKKDVFSSKPDVKGLLKTKFDWDAGFFPTIKIGDVNGDLKKEVIITKNPEEIHIFPWNIQKDMLSKTPQIIKSDIPGIELNTWLFDQNNDGKKDIFLYHPSDTDQHRLILLLAD